MMHPLVLYMAIAQREDLFAEAAHDRLVREARAANQSHKPGLVTSVVGHVRSRVTGRPTAQATV